MNKAELFVSRLPEGTVETAAGVLRVRGLSRAEVMELKKYTSNAAELDVRMLHTALLDPVLSLEEVREWCKAWPLTDIEPVTDKIAELSGMDLDAAAEAAREESFPDGTAQGV